MNNRKPKNKRGKQSRREYAQFIPEAKTLKIKGEIIPNPDYPGKRRVIHQLTVAGETKDLM